MYLSADDSSASRPSMDMHRPAWPPLITAPTLRELRGEPEKSRSAGHRVDLPEDPGRRGEGVDERQQPGHRGVEAGRDHVVDLTGGVEGAGERRILDDHH